MTMNIRVICYLLLLIVAAPVCVRAQERDKLDGVMLFRKDVKFILKEPDGWVLATQGGGIPEGVEAVLYPKGSSWKNAVVVMYARIIQKDETQKTVADVISNDIADFMKLSKDSTVTDAASLPTRDKKQAVVKVFYDAANKNYESVAFIDNAKVVVIIALSSRTKAEYEKALPSFRDLVESYFEFTLSGRLQHPAYIFTPNEHTRAE